MGISPHTEGCAGSEGVSDEPYVTLDKTDNKEQPDKDRNDAESEESGLQLVVDIRGESKSAKDEGE